MQAVFAMSFLVAFGGTLVATAIPLFVRLQGAGDFLTSVVQSASSIVYVVTPLFLSPFVKQFGLRRAVIFSTGIALVCVLIYCFFWSIYTPSLFMLVVTTFFVIHVVDGFWTGLFWPAVETRIADEKQVMSNPQNYEIYVRGYNLAWNAGVTAGYVLLILATVPSAKEEIIPGLFVMLLISVVSYLANFIVGVKYFHAIDVLNPRDKPVHLTKDLPYEIPRKQAFRMMFTAYVVMFMYGFTINQTIQTITNQFTAVANADTNSFNLVLFIPICLITRSILQTLASYSVKIPANPDRRFIPALIGLAGCMAIFGFDILAFPSIGVVGMSIFLPALALLGIIGGVGYGVSIAKIIRESGRSDARLFNGLTETVNGGAALIGMLLSGALTQVIPYYAPYFINLGLLLLAIVLVLVFDRKKV